VGGIESIVRLLDMTSRFSEQMLHQLSAKHGITPAQLFCLTYIRRNPGRTLSDMSAALGVSMPACTRMIDRLVQARLVERYESATDRRARVLSLTDKGAQLEQDVTEERLRLLRSVVERMDGASQQALQHGLDAFLRASPSPETFCLHCGGEHDDDCPADPG